MVFLFFFSSFFCVFICIKKPKPTYTTRFFCFLIFRVYLLLSRVIINFYSSVVVRSGMHGGEKKKIAVMKKEEESRRNGTKTTLFLGQNDAARCS